MTVGADEYALLHLCLYAFVASALCTGVAHLEQFLTVLVMEVHTDWWEHTTAVVARFAFLVCSNQRFLRPTIALGSVPIVLCHRTIIP